MTMKPKVTRLLDYLQAVARVKRTAEFYPHQVLVPYGITIDPRQVPFTDFVRYPTLHGNQWCFEHEADCAAFRMMYLGDDA
jgi:hypothetical protein